MQVARQTAPPARCCPSQQRRRRHKRSILECSGKLQRPCRITSERVYNAFISGALTGRDTLGPLPVWRPRADRPYGSNHMSAKSSNHRMTLIRRQIAPPRSDIRQYRKQYLPIRRAKSTVGLTLNRGRTNTRGRSATPEPGGGIHATGG